MMYTYNIKLDVSLLESLVREGTNNNIIKFILSIFILMGKILRLYNSINRSICNK